MSPLAAAVVVPWLAVVVALVLPMPSSSSSHPMSSTSASSSPLAFLADVDVVIRRRRRRPRGRPPPSAITTTSTIRSLRPSSSSLFAAEDDGNRWDGEGDGDDRPENNPRLSAMRSMLESSWDVRSMGCVPTSPQSASKIVTECVYDAMSSNINVMIIDIRLPGYDILEGKRYYDILAVYDLCSYLSDDMKERGLARKCLVLTMDGRGADEIGRAMRYRQRREKKVGGGTTTSSSSSSSSPEEEEGGRRRSTFVAPSHRLWSAIGRDDVDLNNDEFGPVVFDKIVHAVDENSSLEYDEDALILISPYDIRHVVITRRILARYGRTRTIIVVNPRFENRPREMDDAVVVYGMLPLVARSSSGGGGVGDDDDDDDDGGRRRSGGAGLRAVVMKRYPRDWTVYVDAYGDGFVEAAGGGGTRGNNNERAGGGGGGGGGEVSEEEEGGFPSPEWIARRVQAHVEGLSRRRDLQ